MVDLSTWIEPVPVDDVAVVTGRGVSLFGNDLARRAVDLGGEVSSRRVLVIGAAGSIGSAFTKLLVGLTPRGLALVDISENGLADLVRDLRSSSAVVPEDFRTTVVAFGSPGFLRFLAATGPYDAVFNFSALKHVRTERDAFGLMRMIETNALSVDGLFASRLLAPGSRFFSVSTDKAVNPTNLMGGTKRWMERIIAGAPDGIVGTSARFANVAFSAGSLPQAFLRRLAAGQPLAGPSDVSRYFISHLEAAQLCLVGGFLGEHRDVHVPRLDARNAVSMMEVARRVLEARGYRAMFVETEEEARRLMAEGASDRGFWPSVFTPSDTSGEKELEELTYAAESVDAERYEAISVARQTAPDATRLESAKRIATETAAGPIWEKSELTRAVRTAVPELRHRDLGRSLDEKM